MRQVTEIIFSMLLIYGAYSFCVVSAELFRRIVRRRKKRPEKPRSD